MTITRKKNIANIGRITRALKPPNIPLPLWTPSSTEAYNYELCQKTSGRAHLQHYQRVQNEAGYEVCWLLETESKDCTLQNRVQQANNKFLEEVKYQTIVLPPFVDIKYQSTASMLTGDSSKINLDLSTAISAID